MRKSIGFLAALALVLNFSIASAQGEVPPDAPEGGAAPEAAPMPPADPAPAPAPAADPAPAATGERGLPLKGTMLGGGNITFVVDNNGDATGMQLNIAPVFGMFIMDRLIVLGGLNVGVRFGDLYENFPKMFGAMVGTRYLFMKAMGFMLYAGAGLGINVAVPSEGDSLMGLPIYAEFGAMMPLNSWVALDTGLRFTYKLGLSDGMENTWTMPIGVIGLKAFF